MVHKIISSLKDCYPVTSWNKIYQWLWKKIPLLFLQFFVHLSSFCLIGYMWYYLILPLRQNYSIHRGMTEQMLLAYGQPKEIVTVLMMLYKNTKATIHLLDGNTDLFNIVAGVLPGDTLAPFLFIICLYYVLQTSIGLMKKNGFSQKMKEADNITQKLLQMQTTQRRWSNTSCKYSCSGWISSAYPRVRAKVLLALWNQIRWSLCVLI